MKDERKFEEVLTTIRDAEIDVDAFLEAARLERNEQESRKLTAGQKMGMFGIGCAVVAWLGFWAFLLLSQMLR